jgi:hypothetical protein
VAWSADQVADWSVNQAADSSDAGCHQGCPPYTIRMQDSEMRGGDRLSRHLAESIGER